DQATTLLNQLTRHPDRDVAGEAWLRIGTARYRTDDEAGALAAWQEAANAGGSNAWLGSRRVAEPLGRVGKLEDSIGAYREAARRRRIQHPAHPVQHVRPVPLWARDRGALRPRRVLGHLPVVRARRRGADDRGDAGLAGPRRLRGDLRPVRRGIHGLAPPAPG